MNQSERRLYLIHALLAEQPQYKNLEIPGDSQEQKNLLRSLFNVRMPKSIDDEFRKIQDAYLQEETAVKGITDFRDLTPVQEDIYLWKGDITTLACDAIVNAANSQMLGCFCPCHDCIDNQVHTFSGIQLRLACADQMAAQGREEGTGLAKITPAFNLPARYVIHTVGPIIRGAVTKKDEALLASCYTSCLQTAEETHLESIAFCCISTGEFHFPNKRAAEIAVETVKKFKAERQSNIKVIFNVFKELDFELYQTLLAANATGK